MQGSGKIGAWRYFNIAGKTLAVIYFNEYVFIIVVAPLAIKPAKPVLSVKRGYTVVLRVYYSAPFHIFPDNIMWFSPRNERIHSFSRYSLRDSNKELIIYGIEPEDFGNYVIRIRRRVLRGSFTTSTVITLNNKSKFN